MGWSSHELGRLIVFHRGSTHKMPIRRVFFALTPALVLYATGCLHADESR